MPKTIKIHPFLPDLIIIFFLLYLSSCQENPYSQPFRLEPSEKKPLNLSRYHDIRSYSNDNYWQEANARRECLKSPFAPSPDPRTYDQRMRDHEIDNMLSDWRFQKELHYDYVRP
jgi:hypothetical protein